MEKQIHIACPENNEECKYYPDCHISLHHTLPRRLLKIAQEAHRDSEYQAKLKKVINHPSTQMLVCRNIHDYLDYAASDSLPQENRLERMIGGFNEL